MTLFLPIRKPPTMFASDLVKKREQSLFAGRPESYDAWAETYFEDGPGTYPLDAIRSVYALQPLTQELVTGLNPERRLADMREELAKARYPVAE